MKKTTLLLMLIIMGTQVKAQIGILQKSISKLTSFKNLSYQFIYKQKEAFNDTMVSNRKFALFKMVDDKEIGYYYKFQIIDKGKVMAIDLYKGNNLISLSPHDSTYNTRKTQAITFSRSVIAQLIQLENSFNNKPLKVIKASDTVYNSINSYHLVFINKDTIVNNDHLYTLTHLFIDKNTDLPVGKFSKSHGQVFSKEITDYYTEDSYFNYQIDQNNINVASFEIPNGFHPPQPKPKEETALLAAGTMAPDWTLYDTDGKKTSLSQLKGKVVLLDFFFVGCLHCMSTLDPLDNLHTKYKNKDVVILSISDRDNKKLVTAFKKAQKIKNQMYPNGNDVAKLYHVKEAPIFYFIDRQGKIASVVVGYDEGFEKKMTGIIDSLIKI